MEISVYFVKLKYFNFISFIVQCSCWVSKILGLDYLCRDKKDRACYAGGLNSTLTNYYELVFHAASSGRPGSCLRYHSS